MDSEASPWDDVPSQGTDSKPSSISAPTLASIGSKDAPSPKTNNATRGRGRGRGVKGIKRIIPQVTTILAVDDAMDPLGPLGISASEPEQQQLMGQASAAPSKHLQPSKPSFSSDASLKTLMGSVNLNIDDEDLPPVAKARVPPPVSAPTESTPRHNQPSVSIVEAAHPTFHISVGDPHKVGDLTSTHTEYSVSTRTTSKAYRVPEFSVSRRFRDFLWLYDQLHSNNPGVIVPPPPEKQAMGRFNADFVESRRQALERMLNKIAAHPTLQHDADLKMFLESEALTMDIKHKDKKDPLLAEPKGVLSAIGFSSSTPAAKFHEPDKWFHDRRIYMDAFENQLKALEKGIELVISSHKQMSDSVGLFGDSLNTLSTVEISPSLTGAEYALAQVQYRIRDLHARVAQQDTLTLGVVFEEYIRLCGSCKQAFGMRERAFHAWSHAEADLLKKKVAQEKLLRQGRSQTDRINQLAAEVEDAEKKVNGLKCLFEDMGRLLRSELERFEREKVEDFKSGVETFLESAVEAQKEIIELWETYLMRLDEENEEEEEEGTDEDDSPLMKTNTAIKSKDAHEIDPYTTTTDTAATDADVDTLEARASSPLNSLLPQALPDELTASAFAE